MVSKLLPILFILPIIYAKIEIDISAANEKERDVRISGSYVDLINDIERKTFDLTEENLKKSISTYFGLAPDSVYLRNPTPWGGLYKSLNWEPVKRVFFPKKATILSVETKPVLTDIKNLVNEDSEPKTYNEKINHLLETTVTSKWDKKPELEIEDIHYHLAMKKPEDSMYFGFTAKFGEDTVKTMPINVASEFQVTLKPKQNAQVEFLATKEIMTIRVDFETSLVGAVAMNYDKEYKGHRFWAMDVNTVQEAGGMKKQVESSEVIEVVHLRDAAVRVTDVTTGDVLYTAPATMH
ncbi:spherulin-2A-like [Maniola hyperantus]|uniref:spherulin-2A-like n=1 Tax=Aphantopus hyperantus TaxID=2795564 RepID=UPI001567D5C4|nr:spherulin-2A-like [Maniola hyperantus]XP_034837466.1 spherulin-2A-like [Maniola hyperantus]XP_034837467.1 spherulin-2A-like [Maniola hyperantus]